MNAQSIIDKVTAKLAGEFYVGQRVQVADPTFPLGTIVEITHEGRGATIKFDDGISDGYYLWALKAIDD